MADKAIRVLVTDDTVLYRKVLSDILGEIPGVDVVGTASNGKIALDKIDQLKPDMMTLDVEMPVMDGLSTLRELKRVNGDLAVVMVSSLTREGADVTMKALELGAFGFITKAEGSSLKENRKFLMSQLQPLIQSVSMRKNRRQARARQRSRQPVRKAKSGVVPMHVAASPPGRVEVVAIGISTGGPNALAEVIPRLPKTLRVPVVIVQHMPPVFTKALADSLNQKSPLTVVEAADGEDLRAGKVYIAPGGKQMKVVRKAAGAVLELTDDPPENHCKPAADYLFRSIAKTYRNRALGVIMTGMGADGVKGLREMRQLGSQVIAQDEESCIVYGMPMEAMKAGIVDVVLPLGQIASEITGRIR